MSHLDDDSIAASANGDTLADGASEHLRDCEQCARRVRELDDLIRQATTAGRPQPLLVPPTRVWNAIVAEIASDDAVDDDALDDAAVDDDALDDDAVGQTHGDSADVSGGGEGPQESLAAVTPIRRFTPLRIFAAAAVGVVIGGVGVGLWTGRSGDSFTVVASASLTNLVTDAPAGSAKVEDQSGGAHVLVVDTTYSPPAGADLEVWLIDPNIEGMVSLGFLTSSHGEFVIPAGYSASAYPIVDISIEPRDGVPTHSGDSVTRGTLGT